MTWMASLKWKLAFGFMALFLVLAGAFALGIYSSFKNEKMRYVTESQRKEVAGAAGKFLERAAQAKVAALSILSAYNFKSHVLPPSAQGVLEHLSLLRAIEVCDEATGQVLLALEKEKGLLGKNFYGSGNASEIFPLGGDRYLARFRESEIGSRPLQIKVIFEDRELFQDGFSSHNLLLLQGGRLIKRNSAPISTGALRALLSELPRATQAKVRWAHGGGHYWVSMARVPGVNLQFVSVVNEAQALGDRKIFFIRIAIFVVAGLLLTLALFVLSFRRFTLRLQTVRQTAERMAEGDFSTRLLQASHDETGLLTRSLARIGESMQVLLARTASEARQQSEVDSARELAHAFAPTQASYRNGNIRLFGLLHPNEQSPCEFWCYRQNGSSLFMFLGKAKVSGPQAALLHAAMQSVFISLVDGGSGLRSLARALDQAAFASSGGKSTAAGLVLQVDVEFGEVRMIRAGYPEPICLGNENVFADLALGFRFGQMKELWQENRLQLTAGQRLLVYSQGLLEVGARSAQYKSEKLFLERVSAAFSKHLSPEGLVRRVESLLPAAGAKNQEVTIVALDFKI